jgi:hypothetical protein
MTKPTKKGGTWYQRDLLLVIQEKLRRGRCSYHPQFNDGREKYVTIHNYMEFAFDHVDRTTKHITIAKAIGRWSTPHRLITEMTKCVLTCHNCHTRKGFDSGDFVDVTKIDSQMRLFDAK